MKYSILYVLAVAFVFFLGSIVFAAGDAPAYLKGGTITVTLKDGKSYKFSADEYAVVKRGAESVPLIILMPDPAQSHKKSVPVATSSSSSKTKNIISIGLVRSNRGFSVDHGSNVVSVTQKKEFAGSIMYQRNIQDELYLGGRVDANSGAEVNLGLGF